jgi:hypothetical protein
LGRAFSRPHPALERPLVAAVVMLARKHRQRSLDELGTRLDRLSFVGRPGFLASKEGPNIPEESAFRWLALSRKDRNLHFHRDGRFLPTLWIADSLTELLRKALRTGEVYLVEGPDAVMDSIEFADGQVLRAMRVEAVTVEPSAPAIVGGGTVDPAVAAESKNTAALKQGHGGGRPPDVREHVQAWFEALPPDDRALSDSKLADIWKSDPINPGDRDSVRKIIGALRRAGAGSKPGLNLD